MPIQYPIRAVAKLTGIPIDTLRAWERRYRAVAPDRTLRGRLYSDADVRRLVLLRTAVEGGHAIGQIAGLTDGELQAIAQAAFPRVAAPRPEPDTAPGSPELQPLWEAIEALDHISINAELNRFALLLSPAGLVHRVVLPLLRRTGEGWKNGTLQIAQEHMFTACLRNLLGSLVRLPRPGANAPRILIATPANELHEFGILCAAMLAAAQDFQVAYLGPDLPVQEILSATQKCAPQVVVLGITSANVTLELHHEMGKLAAGLPASTELWAGGSGASEVFRDVVRDGTFLIEDLEAFDRQLLRFNATYRREITI
jgi:DNA-binding transcriptional MerR regulator/methylmalonyl-CoA mutase cobalamin-binding subunit